MSSQEHEVPIHSASDIVLQLHLYTSWTQAMSITEPEMSSIKKSRQICKTVADVVRLTVQSQTRAMAKATKEKATAESVRALMREDCKALGILDIDRDLPPVVHVAGTKGLFQVSLRPRLTLHRQGKHMCLARVDPSSWETPNRTIHVTSPRGHSRTYSHQWEATCRRCV